MEGGKRGGRERLKRAGGVWKQGGGGGGRGVVQRLAALLETIWVTCAGGCVPGRRGRNTSSARHFISFHFHFHLPAICILSAFCRRLSCLGVPLHFLNDNARRAISYTGTARTKRNAVELAESKAAVTGTPPQKKNKNTKKKKNTALLQSFGGFVSNNDYQTRSDLDL